MIIKLTGDIGEELVRSLSTRRKNSRVIQLAVNRWKAIMSNQYHGGVVIPPTHVFSQF